MKRIFREPLFHFLVLGAALFGLHGLLSGPGREARGAQIVISDQTLVWLDTMWQKQWGRPPTPEELQRQIDQHVREEILYREALAMGLDRDDAVVRRRLAQKVEFLARDLGGLTEPTEEEIRESYEANLDRYRAEGWTPTLEQVRDAVKLDLLEHRREKALDDYFTQISRKYRVERTASSLTIPGGDS